MAVPVSVTVPGALGPTRLTARTCTVYVTPGSRPVRMADRSLPSAVRVPPGNMLIWKPVIGTPSAPSAGTPRSRWPFRPGAGPGDGGSARPGSAASAIVQVKDYRGGSLSNR